MHIQALEGIETPITRIPLNQLIQLNDRGDPYVPLIYSPLLTEPANPTEGRSNGCQMRVFGTGVLGTRYCRVPVSKTSPWYISVFKCPKKFSMTALS